MPPFNPQETTGMPINLTDDTRRPGYSKPVGDPNISTTEEGQDNLSDVGTDELPGGDGKRDPISEEVTADRVETIQSLGIGPRDPYPTGNPPTTERGASKNPSSKTPNEGAQGINDYTVVQGEQPPSGLPRSEPLKEDGSSDGGDPDEDVVRDEGRPSWYVPA
jgi:hypothetical protein